MSYQPYGAPTGVPAEAQSVKSLLHGIRILAIIFGILLALGGIAYIALVAASYAACSPAIGVYCAPIGGLIALPIAILLFGIVDVLIYVKMQEIENLVDQRHYEEAKSRTLLWMILGFVFGAVIPGILLLVAYLKFDPLINWQRGGMGSAGSYYPAYGAPPAAPPGTAPAAMPPAQPAAPPVAPPVQTAPMTPCPRCGRPLTWVPQYNRWFCSTEQQYL